MCSELERLKRESEAKQLQRDQHVYFDAIDSYASFMARLERVRPDHPQVLQNGFLADVVQLRPSYPGVYSLGLSLSLYLSRFSLSHVYVHIEQLKKYMCNVYIGGVSRDRVADKVGLIAAGSDLGVSEDAISLLHEATVPLLLGILRDVITRITLINLSTQRTENL